MTATAAALVALVNSANASITYVFTGQQYNNESIVRGATLNLALTVSNQAVERGTFNLNESVSTPGTNYGNGDLADFQSLSWTVGTSDSGYVTTTSGSFTSLRALFTFNDGVPSGMLTVHGETSEFALSGTSGGFGGTVASDFNNCNGDQDISRCKVSGRLEIASSVPEPATLGLLSLGLTTACTIRRRTRLLRKVFSS